MTTKLQDASQKEFHILIANMERYGGNFCRHLAAAIMFADRENRDRIFKAFPEIIEKYGPCGQFATPQ